MAKAYLNGIKYRQFGKDVLLVQIRVQQLLALFEIDHNVQRDLDPNRRLAIRTFILENLEREQPFYFGSCIFSARQQLIEDENGFYLKEDEKFYVLDGQHRLKAIESALLTLKTSLEAAQYIHHPEKVQQLEKQIKTLHDFQLPMQIYLDLTTQQERQLFVDHNSERREAQPGQLLQFDTRDPYSVLSRKIAEKLQDDIEIDMNASRVVRTSSALTTLVTMKRCIIALFEGSLSNRLKESPAPNTSEEITSTAEAFFRQWFRIFPKNSHDRERYVTGLSGIQIALALTCHHFVKQHKLSHLQAIALLEHLKTLKWRPNEPIFSHIYNPTTRKIAGHSTTYGIQKTAKLLIEVIEQEMAVKQ